MAKRFTDTDKWKKTLLKSMPAEYKLLWLYICDDCDHAGIWHVDIDVAGLRIGEQINEQKAIEIFGSKIIVFDGGEKWFIPGFIEFQYGELNEKNRVHESILKILNKYNLLENKLLTSPLQGVKDKDKDKEQDMEEDKDKGVQGENLLWTKIVKDFFNDFRWKEKFCIDKKITLSNLEERMREFIANLELKEDFKPLKEIKSHFVNTFNKQKNGSGKANDKPANEQRFDKRVEYANRHD